MVCKLQPYDCFSYLVNIESNHIKNVTIVNLVKKQMIYKSTKLLIYNLKRICQNDLNLLPKPFPNIFIFRQIIKNNKYIHITNLVFYVQLQGKGEIF